MDKSIFNFKIQYKDGTILDLHEDKNLWVSTFRIISPTPEHFTQDVTGRYGTVYMGSTLKERKIKSTIMVEAVDYIDFDLIRDELFKIFNPLEKFYIIRDLQPGKRMEVSVAGDFDLDYLTLEDGEFPIEFVIHSVFLESIGTTLSPFTFDSDKWQIGQGLIAEDVSYIHNTTKFKIYNPGDITINPRQIPLHILYKGASNRLSIKNITSGEEWQHYGISVQGDTIELLNVRCLKNGISILGNSNKVCISILPGWNEFNINGAIGSFEILFDFRFYYF